MAEPEALADELEVVDLDVGGRASGVATVTIDRPEARNAMNEAVRDELKLAMAALDDADAVRTVVLTGSDEAASFVAGADVRDLQGRGPLDQRTHGERPRVYEAVAEAGVPVIAAINGHALGGGCELALACDVRIAREDAKLGQPEVTLGLMPGGGATQRLPRLVGPGQARRLVLAGEVIDATEAARIGLVEEVHPPEAFEERVYALAGRVASNAPLSVELARRALDVAEEVPLSAGLRYESELFHVLFDADDKEEGIAAFLEGREPEWSGR
ncbi:MAG: enoyl-CoA hydratase/isomerase family protein [Halobacteriales archaeon]